MRPGHVLLPAAMVLFISPQAAAQDRFISAGTGVTFGGSTAPLAQIAARASFAPRLEMVGEFTYMRDVLPRDVLDAVTQTARSFERFQRAVFGQDVAVQEEAGAKAVSGAVGVRLVPWAGNVRPFIQIDGGFTRVDPEIRYLIDGQDVNLAPPGDGPETKPTLGLGAGITMSLGERWAGEARYRFSHTFAEHAFELYRVTGFNINAVNVSLSRRF